MVVLTSLGGPGRARIIPHRGDDTIDSLRRVLSLELFVGIAVALACGSPPQQSIRIALVEEINKRNVEERGSLLCVVVELAVG